PPLHAALPGSSAPAGSRPDTPPAAPTAAPLPAGSTQAPAAPGPFAQDVPSLQAARADAAGTTVERGGQGPGLSGLGGVAAGVTMAAVANPAGTTHAYAPDSAVRARRPQESRDQQNGSADGGTDQEDTPDAQQRLSRRSGTGPTAAAAAAASAAAGAGSPATAAGHVGSAGVASSGQTAERSVPGNHGAEDAQNRHSRYLQWLYWSLIAVTYCCLGLALATVAPDLFGLPMPPESLGTWRNVLT